jgi:hypothetical protein
MAIGSLFSAVGEGVRAGTKAGFNPNVVKGSAMAGAGIYGYASSDEGGFEAVMRGAAFAGGAGLLGSKTFRAKMSKQSKVIGRSIAMKGTKRTLGALGQRFIGQRGARRAIAKGARTALGATGRGSVKAFNMTYMGLGAAAGGVYGALDEDSTVFGGMLVGGFGAGITRGIVREAGRGMYGKSLGAGIAGGLGYMAGGAPGFALAAPVGAGIGGAVGAVAKMGQKSPRLAKFIGGATLTGIGSGAILGFGAMQGLAAHTRDYSLGADGNLALGLHANRHG